jgi:hypothetical protein
MRKSKRPQVVVKYVSIAPGHLSSSDRIDWALATIASDVEGNDGVYPCSDRRPTTQEVLRRAGLGPRYLERKGDSAPADLQRERLKEKIKAGLSKINGTRPILTIGESSTSSDKRIESQELRQLRQLWCERELEFIETENCLAETQAELARLRDEILKLRTQLGYADLHILKPRQ